MKIYNFTKVDISSIKPYINNARQHSNEQIYQIMQSIREFGFTNPLIIDSDGNLIAGHGRLEAIKQLNRVDFANAPITQIPSIVIDGLSDTQKRALVIADNQIALNASWDYDLLKSELLELENENYDMGLLGFSDDELLEIVEYEKGVFHSGDKSDLDSSDIVDTTPKLIKRGDLITLGRHRLVCGDSTNADDMARLMGERKAEIAFFSPPYNAGGTFTESKSHSFIEKLNNSKYISKDKVSDSEYLALLNGALRNALNYCECVFINIQSLAGNKIPLIDFLAQNKDKYLDTMIWHKDHCQPNTLHRVLGRKFEYIHIFSNKGTGSVGCKDFESTIYNIFEMGGVKSNEFSNVHSATFPEALPTKFMRDFANESIVDLFGGTGTTMIAAEKMNFDSYLMELEPFYCELIVKRFCRDFKRDTFNLNGKNIDISELQ